jgi:purine-nucleoside/S-methyl-5'-thioadenosine phosphorylase / adenosine deaminase
MNSGYCCSENGDFLYHQNLASFKWLRHGFSLRSSPSGRFEQSLGFSEYQSREVVERNRSKFVRSVLRFSRDSDREAPTVNSGGAMGTLIVMRQSHTDIVHPLTTYPEGEFSAEGDGLVTDRPGLWLAVLTADCMPVLLADLENRVVAAVHAGWRGTAKRIVEKAFTTMQRQFTCSPENCIAVVGPSIRGCCYEVGEEVVRVFHNEFEYAPKLFQALPLGKWSLDLPTACRFQLLHAGVRMENIFSDPACTSCNVGQFFSHRAEQGNTGRMMSLIGILTRP